MVPRQDFLLLIEPEAHSGAWNMAVDEALLETALTENLAALRFYRWREPTLSVGYFQKTLPPDLPAELQTIARVRRLSGGGAILHHHDWTYSCVLPSESVLAINPIQLYDFVHEEIIKFLYDRKIPAALRGSSGNNRSPEPFLCFGRGDPRDIVLGAHKILGSAQRRRRGAVLQHGSFLLRRSPLAAMYPGLFDLVESNLPVDDWIPEIARRIAERLREDREINFQADELPGSIAEAASRLVKEKYSTLDWR